jgi:Mg2+-importing ATPase
MGDGINDAPVLKVSDVGISVNNAVDVAKETADIILLNKNLHVLKDGVIEGRKTFQNTLKYLKMGFSSNFGNMFSMMGASFILPFFPMMSSQILLNNFLYDVSQTALPTDSTDDEAVKHPLSWNMREFFKYIIVFGLISSIFDFLTFYILYAVFNLNESQFQTGWFIESIATQILIIFIIRTKRVPFFKSTPGIFITLSAIFVVILAWVIPYTSLGTILSFTPLPPILILLIIGIVISYLIITEISKYFFYRLFTTAP